MLENNEIQNNDSNFSRSEIRLGNLVSVDYNINLVKKQLNVVFVPTKDNLKEILSLAENVGSYDLLLPIYDSNDTKFCEIKITALITELIFSSDIVKVFNGNVYTEFQITNHGVTYV